MLKAIIFDCDGVLLRSNKPYADVFERLAKKYGVHESYKDLYSHFGEHPRQIIEEIFHDHNTNKIFDEYKKMIGNKNFIKRIRIIPGTRKMLEKLSKKYGLALASGSMRAPLMRMLKKYSLEKYFDAIITGDEVRQAKPHPEILINAVKKLKVRKDEVLYVGDAPNDAKAAKRAGIRFVAVLTGVFKNSDARKFTGYIISDITKIEMIKW